MTLTIEVPKPIEDRLIEQAKSSGLDLAKYVAKIVEAHAARPTLKELSGEVYEQFLASGMSDEELGEFLEKAKHEMRAERRAKAAHAR